MVDLAAPGEGGVVGDEGLVRQVVQADAFFICQRVLWGQPARAAVDRGRGDELGVVGRD